MRNIRLDLEYDGTAYSGWQVQPRVPTIQEKIEEALYRITGQRVRVSGAGRTDAGVHALGQVAHFHSDTSLPVDVLLRALNSLLPDDIVVKAVRDVPGSFHARKGASGKRYEYWILNDPTPSAFHRRYFWHLRRPLDVEAMGRAARRLAGKHDFSSFQASGGECGRSAVRSVNLLDVEIVRERYLRVAVEANGFLRGMVRILVGTLVEVGEGKIAEEDVSRILEARDRRVAGRTAPARGLFLVWVRYPGAAEAAGTEVGRFDPSAAGGPVPEQMGGGAARWMRGDEKKI